MRSRVIAKMACILLLVSNFVYANNIGYRNVTSNNLLSHTSVQCIAQDKAGFIWIGTKDGLNRYDGHQYRSFKYDPKDSNSISNNEICCLTVQGDSLLWLGTRGGGVNCLNIKNNKITRFAYDSYDGIVRGITVDPETGVWIGTNKGLFKLEGSPESDKAFFRNMSLKAIFRSVNNESFVPDPINVRVQKILPLKKGKFLVAADSGIFEYDLKRGEFKLISYDLQGVSVTTNLLIDRNGVVWISNYDGLLKLTPNKNGDSYSQLWYNSKAAMPYRLRTDRINDVVADKNGNVWIALHGEGLALLNDNGITYLNDDFANELSGHAITVLNDLFIDKSGMLWMGAENDGVLTIDLNKSVFNTIEPSCGEQVWKNNLQVKAITGNEQTIWIGTLVGGIEVFHFNEGQLTFQDNISLKSNNGQGWNIDINVLLYDKDGELWIGGGCNFLIRYNQQKQFLNYDTNGYIFSLMEDKTGKIWFGTWRQGFGYFDKKSGKIEQYNDTPQKMLGLSSDKVLSILEDSRGYLFVGTKGGGLNIAPISDVVARKGKFSVFQHSAPKESTISHNDVYKIFEARNGDIWLGTGRGIVKLVAPNGMTFSEALANGSVQFDEITEKNGLPGGIVYSINEDEAGDLWLGTSRGLCRFSPINGNVCVVDELYSSVFESNATYSDKKTGYLFMAGLCGITYFRPDSVFQSGKDYSVRLTDFRIQNQRIEPGQTFNGRVVLSNDIAYTSQIELNHSEKLISFEFSALDFSPSQRVRYAYRLVGFNDDWIEVNDRNRLIIYTNLTPGTYDLQVKALKSDGTFSDKLTQLKITVLPPVWLTPWAYAVYLLLALFLLLVFRRYSIIAVEKKNQLIIKEIEHRKEVEMSEAKIRFFTNVSHEIRTPLTLIYEPLKQLLSHDELPAGAKELANMVMRNMKRLLNQVNQLLELRKIDGQGYALRYSKFSIKELFSNIIYDFESAIQNKIIRVEYELSGELEIYADRQLLDTVVYNLVSNALKFLPTNGVLQLKALRCNVNECHGEPCVKLLVCDSGPGIPTDEVSNIFNYFYQAKDVEKLNIGGTGIGLSIVKEYVELHNGSVRAYNRDVGGCCFEVVLPLNLDGVEVFSQPVDAVKNEIVEEENEKKSFTGLEGQEYSMVVVEDDVDLATYLKRIFLQQFKVTHFSDGKTALENIAEIAPDIIICDLMLPQLSGLDLTARLKENLATNHIPIIMLTAKDEEETKIQGLQFGADVCLTKPFSASVLMAQVVSVIKSRNALRDRIGKYMMLEPAKGEIVTRDQLFIQKIMALVEERLADSTFEVTDIVKEMEMSYSLLLKKFKAISGMSLVEFVRSMRIKKAVYLFEQDKLFISDVSSMVGFSDPKYFSKCFTKQVGVSPSEFVKKFHE